MEFQDVVRRRRMVRNFAERPVPAHIVDRVLENALRAPSAGFSQGWAFVVLEGPAQTAEFWGDGPLGPRWQGVARAPVIVVALSNRQTYLDRYAEADKGWTDRDESRWAVPYWHVDTGMASLLMLLTAVDAGLGALFFGLPHDRWARLGPALGVPQDYTPVGAVALGYPAPDEPSPSLKRGRRPASEVIHRGRFRPAPGPPAGS